MTRIVDANHMALVPRGRAGPVASILDHGGATVKSAKDFVSGVIRYVRRRRAGLVKDYVGEPTVSGPYNDGGFGSGLSSLISTRAAMKEEEVAEKVDELMKLVADLPGGDEKDLIKKYMSDMKLMKDLKDDELYDTKGIICSLVEKLDRRGEREAKGMKDEKTKDCASCDGTGKTKDGKDCASCGGSGHVKDAVRDEPGPVAATSGAPAAAAAPLPLLRQRLLPLRRLLGGAVPDHGPDHPRGVGRRADDVPGGDAVGDEAGGPGGRSGRGGCPGSRREGGTGRGAREGRGGCEGGRRRRGGE